MNIATNKDLLPKSKREYEDMLSSTVFTQNIAKDLIRQGIYFTMPYEKTKGGVYFIHFNDESKDSHALITGPSYSEKTMKSIIDMMLQHSTVPTILFTNDDRYRSVMEYAAAVFATIDSRSMSQKHSVSKTAAGTVAHNRRGHSVETRFDMREDSIAPITQRKRLTELNERMDSFLRANKPESSFDIEYDDKTNDYQYVFNNEDPDAILVKTPLLVIIDGLDSIIKGLRSSSNRQRYLDTINHMMDIGPRMGMHFVLIQRLDDDGINALKQLNRNFDTSMSIGQLSPICSQLVFNDSYGTAIPRKRWVAGYKDRDKTGLIKIPRK